MDANLTYPIKRIGVTMFGKRINIYVHDNITHDDFFDSFKTCKKLMAEFYFPFLIISDNALLLLEDNMIKNGKYRFENKKNFRLLQSSIRKNINYMCEYFAVPEYFEELSAQVWDDVKEKYEKLRYAIYLVISKNGISKNDAELYAHLVVAANVIYMAQDTYEAICKEIKDKTTIDFSEILEHTSNVLAYNFVSQWMRSFIRNYDSLEAEIVSNESVKIGRDAINMAMVDGEKLHAREVAAYNEMDDIIKVAWKSMRERPKNRRRVIIYRDGRTKEYLYNKNMLTSGGDKLAWDNDADWMWIYANEKDKKVDFAA